MPAFLSFPPHKSCAHCHTILKRFCWSFYSTGGILDVEFNSTRQPICVTLTLFLPMCDFRVALDPSVDNFKRNSEIFCSHVSNSVSCSRVRLSAVSVMSHCICPPLNHINICEILLISRNLLFLHLWHTTSQNLVSTTSSHVVTVSISIIRIRINTSLLLREPFPISAVKEFNSNRCRRQTRANKPSKYLQADIRPK